MRLRLVDERQWASAPWEARSVGDLVRGCSAARAEASAAGIPVQQSLTLVVWVPAAGDWATAAPGGYQRRITIKDPERVWTSEWRQCWEWCLEAAADYEGHAQQIAALATWAGDEVIRSEEDKELD